MLQKLPRKKGLPRWLRVGGSLLGLAFLLGCASPGRQSKSAEDLAGCLRHLSSSVDETEASLTAQIACAYSSQLAKEYRVVRPAIFHNVLVNLGIRQRGLCFQWADDLTQKLQSLKLQSLVLHRGVARLDTRREHSSVVLTARGQPFEEGLVLDAWRHSGDLYWGAVKADKYPWMEVQIEPLVWKGPER